MREELCLPSGTLGCHNQATGNGVGNLRTKVSTHQVQAGIYTGSAACRGNQLAAVYVKHAWVYFNEWIACREFVRIAPVGGGTLAVQKARSREHEHPEQMESNRAPR